MSGSAGAASLVIALDARIGNLETALRRTETALRRTDATAKQTQASMGRITGSFGGMGNALGSLGGLVRGAMGPLLVAFTGAALVQGMASAVRNINALADAAAQVGLEARQLQAIQVAFEEAGSSAEVAQQGVARLATLIGDAARGSKEAQETFVKLGVSFQNIDGTARSTEQVFDQLAERIRGAASEQEALSMAAEVFGTRGARAAVAAMREMDGSIGSTVDKFRALGIIIGAETAQKLDSLGTAFANLGRVIVAAIADAVAYVEPVLTWLIERITALVRWGIQQISDFAGWARRQGRALGIVSESPLEQAETALSRANAAFGAAIRDRDALITQNAHFERTMGDQLTDALRQDALEQERLADERVIALQRERDQKKVIYDQMVRDARPPEAGNAPAAAPPRVTAGGGSGSSSTNREAEHLERQAEAFRRMADPFRQIKQDIQELNQHFAAGRVTADEYGGAMEALKQRLAEVGERANQAGEETRGFWAKFQQGMGMQSGQNATTFGEDVGAGLGKIVSGSFGEIFNLLDAVAQKSMTAGDAIKKFALSFVQSIAQMVAQAAAMRMLQAFMGGMSGGKGGGGGGLLGMLFGGARMAGGAVAGGYTYLVGERGPELFTAPGAGRIVPNSEMGGGMQVVVNQNAPGVVVESRQIDERTVEVAVNRSRAQVAQDFAASARTGHGPYAEPLGKHFAVRRRL